MSNNFKKAWEISEISEKTFGYKKSEFFQKSLEIVSEKNSMAVDLFILSHRKRMKALQKTFINSYMLLKTEIFTNEIWIGESREEMRKSEFCYLETIADLESQEKVWIRRDNKYHSYHFITSCELIVANEE